MVPKTIGKNELKEVTGNHDLYDYGELMRVTTCVRLTSATGNDLSLAIGRGNRGFHLVNIASLSHGNPGHLFASDDEDEAKTVFDLLAYELANMVDDLDDKAFVDEIIDSLGQKFGMDAEAMELEPEDN